MVARQSKADAQTSFDIIASFDSQLKMANPTRCRPVVQTDQRVLRAEMIQEFSTTFAIFEGSRLLNDG
jgi:hypothetical protein